MDVPRYIRYLNFLAPFSRIQPPFENWTHKKFDFFVSGFQKGPPFDKRGPFYEISCIFSLDFKQTFESWTIVSGLPFENWTLPLFG